MVTEKEEGELSAKDTALCSSCQMLVIWIQNQLKRKTTKDRIFNYVNQVSLSNDPVQKPALLLRFISLHDALIYFVRLFAAVRELAKSKWRVRSRLQ